MNQGDEMTRFAALADKLPSHGISWGLEYTLVYGQLVGSEDWAVWNRHTRNIVEVFAANPNQHGWSDAQNRAKNRSEPEGYSLSFNNFELDAVS